MVRVGHLHAPVAPVSRSDERLLCTGASDRLAMAEQRRPILRAGPVAGAATIPVSFEEIKGASRAVDDDSAERRARRAEFGRLGGDIDVGTCWGSRAVRRRGILRARGAAA